MAKRKREIDYEAKMEQDGRGKGEGSDYKPLYNNQDLTPKGTTTRTQDNETRRQVFAISKIELKLRKVLEFGMKVKNIKELYPINLQESQRIADQLGVKHPSEKKQDKIRPIAISLLVTENDESDNRIVAIHYVNANSLTNRCQINELEIIRIWCREKGYKFTLVTDELLKSTAVENINMLHNYLDVDNLEIGKIDIDELIEIEKWILEKAIENDESIRDLCRRGAQRLDIKVEYVLSIYRHLVAHSVIKVELNQPWDASKIIQVGISSNRFKELIWRYRTNDSTERYL